MAAVTANSAAPLDPAALAQLVKRCAPQVNPSTMLALIGHESGGDPYAIGVNGPQRHNLRSKNATIASSQAAALIRTGQNIDMGLGQINAANLARLKLTSTTVFEPCRNIGAAAQLLTQAYVRARPTAASDQAALDAALSTYNTGSPQAGMINGYVAQVRNQYTVPALVPKNPQAAAVTARRVRAPAWDVYGAARQTPASEAQPVAPAKAGTVAAMPAAAATNEKPGEPVMVFEAGARQ